MDDDKIKQLLKVKKPLTREQVRAMFPAPKTLDITNWKQQGIELHQAITKACDPSITAVVTRMFDELLLTRTQYTSLMLASGQGDMLTTNEDGDFTVDPNDMIYRTKHNVMEVSIKDGE